MSYLSSYAYSSGHMPRCNDLRDSISSYRGVGEQGEDQVYQFVRSKVDQRARLEQVGDISEGCLLYMRR
jgi:hypothetical protein